MPERLSPEHLEALRIYLRALAEALAPLRASQAGR
jgi:hypothetical protein